MHSDAPEPTAPLHDSSDSRAIPASSPSDGPPPPFDFSSKVPNDINNSPTATRESLIPQLPSNTLQSVKSLTCHPRFWHLRLPPSVGLVLIPPVCLCPPLPRLLVTTDDVDRFFLRSQRYLRARCGPCNHSPHLSSTSLLAKISTMVSAEPRRDAPM